MQEYRVVITPISDKSTVMLGEGHVPLTAFLDDKRKYNLVVLVPIGTEMTGVEGTKLEGAEGGEVPDKSE